MQGRVALVTGGTGGIGKEITKQLADAGCRVASTGYPPERDQCDRWLEESKAKGYNFTLVYGDVIDFDSCASMVAQVQEALGPIDILVNNAGITRDGTLRKMTKPQWDAVLATNLDSVFNMTRHVIEGMMDRGFGRIVNISSVNGQRGQFGQTNYSAAKAGMHGFTMALGRETARKGVTVNTVSPGYIATEMVIAIAEDVRNKIIAEIPVGRLGKPEEVGRLVTFLADEESGFITGANFSINGGFHMSS
jgi:acetoacetyl-CoA reductase